MAINQNIVDEVLLATLIAQNGRTRGQIVFDQTKSSGLANWNPATNGEAAREQEFQARMLATPSIPEKPVVVMDQTPFSRSEIDAMIENGGSPETQADVAAIRDGISHWQEELRPKSHFLSRIVYTGMFCAICVGLYYAACYWVNHN